MSALGGCLVCGQVLGPDDDLRCSDCRTNQYMEQTGTKATFVQLTDHGPIDADYVPDALEALKDIVNAADNGQPYSKEEVEGFVLPILGKAYASGFRLGGEE